MASARRRLALCALVVVVAAVGCGEREPSRSASPSTTAEVPTTTTVATDSTPVSQPGTGTLDFRITGDLTDRTTPPGGPCSVADTQVVDPLLFDSVGLRPVGGDSGVAQRQALPPSGRVVAEGNPPSLENLVCEWAMTFDALPLGTYEVVYLDAGRSVVGSSEDPLQVVEGDVLLFRNYPHA